MQSPHSPRVIDTSDGACLVECPERRQGRASDIPIGIGLPMFDRITAEMLAENHRDAARSFLMVGSS